MRTVYLSSPSMVSTLVSQDTREQISSSVTLHKVVYCVVVWTTPNVLKVIENQCNIGCCGTLLSSDVLLLPCHPLLSDYAVMISVARACLTLTQLFCG